MVTLGTDSLWFIFTTTMMVQFHHHLVWCVLFHATVLVVSSFSLHSSFMGLKCRPTTTLPSTLRWTMRDHSASTRFKVGDQVRVVASVLKMGHGDLRGSTGTVQTVWEKCEVDPTCCCAEQVDPNMAVRVEFFTGQQQPTQKTEDAVDNKQSATTFTHYFAEEELDPVAATPSAFDGMTCTAFKVDALGLNDRKRGIASYDPNQANG